MKRNFARQLNVVVILILTSASLSSCSSLWAHRGSSSDQEKDKKPAVVSKDQYDELARKYQELLNQVKAKSDTKSEAKPTTEVVAQAAPAISASTGMEQVKPEAPQTTMIDPSEVVNKIDQAIPDAKHVEGVDVLEPTEKKAGPPVPESMGVQNVNLTDDVDDQIIKLREATDLVKVNKFENALTILKELENSKEKQIVVRAKMALGDLLYSQGEYDLAMQVYEEIVKKYAFSGHVLKALGKLVACSEKLKQPEKQSKYYSLLHDFFEAS